MVLLSCMVYAGTLTGTVVDSTTQKGIPFAGVHLMEVNVGAVADEHGHFEIHHSLPFPLTIQCSALGYESATKKLSSKDISSSIVIALASAHSEVDEIKIIASGIQGKTLKTTVESKKLSTLNNIPSINLTEAISNMASVYNRSTGNAIGKPVVRGLSGTRIVTSLNGLRIENQQWGGDHGLGISELGIGQVSIIKGPSSLIYGADALGGVLRLSDQKYTSAGSVDVVYNTLFQSTDLSFKNKIGVRLGGRKLRFNVYAYHMTASDYEMPSGEYADNSRWQEGAVKMALGYNGANWVTNIRYTYIRSFLGLPGHTHDSIPDLASFRVTSRARNWKLPVQQVNSHFLQVENSWFYGKSSLKLSTGYTANKLTELEDKVTIPGINSSLQNGLYRLQYKRHLNNANQLLLGSQGSYQFNSNIPGAESQLIPDAFQMDNGAYGLWNWKKNKLEGQLGARFDHRHVNVVNKSRNYAAGNGSASLVRSSKEFTWRLNLSTGFRPPHISELTSDGVHHGSIRYEIGDIELQSEFAQQLDLGFEYEGEHASVVLNPFINQINNFIQLTPIDSTIQGYNVFAYTQTDRALLTGGDLGVHFHPHFLHNLHVESVVSYLYTRDHMNNPLSLIPHTRINNNIKYKFKGNHKLQVEDISVQYQYFFAKNEVALLETTSPAYQLLHAGINIKLKSKNPLLIKLGCRNILNSSYIDHISRLKNIQLQHPGRNFYMGVQWKINKSKNLHEHEK